MAPTDTPLFDLKSSLPRVPFHSPGFVLAAFTHYGSWRRWVQKPAAPLPWMSPNPFTKGLSISSCRVCNTLPRCHYCTITYQIPPVYYHYRSVSAIINDSSTPADERDYWLTEEVRRLGIAQTLPVCFFSCILRYCSSWAAFCKLGQSVLYNVQSCCYFKSRFAAEIQVSKS